MSDQPLRDQLSAGLQDIRESLQADHADLEVLGLQGTVARVRLLITPETCQECIMPRDFLEDIMLMSIKDTMPQVTKVELEDPRGE